MSEKEDFLSRWSRRKQEAVRDARLDSKSEHDSKSAREDEAAQATEKKREVSLQPSQAAVAPSGKEAEPLFDLSTLPSLDSIGPGTDVRAFMQPGVPTSLSRAALRRAWSADPAIRDFIGLSENAWDFTKPESIPGFGGLLPIDDVKRLLSDVLPNKIESLLEAGSEPRAALQHVAVEGEKASTLPQAPATEQELDTDNSTGTASSGTVSHCTQNDLALQQEASQDVEPPAGSKRRHGRALPT